MFHSSGAILNCGENISNRAAKDLIEKLSAGIVCDDEAFTPGI
jgi:hypothetical protein